MGNTLIFIIIIAALLFFVPSVIAYNRNHDNRGWVLLLNILLGWTGLGWIFCLFWAIFGKTEGRTHLETRYEEKMANVIKWCPNCGAAYNSHDYSESAERIFCSSCKNEITRNDEAPEKVGMLLGVRINKSISILDF